MNNKKTFALFNYVKNRGDIPGIIESEARDKKQIIYGRQAMNKQRPGYLHPPTEDYDVYTRRPKQTADKMQNRLDKKITHYDMFYSRPAQHPGTYRVLNVGVDMKRNTEDDIEVADYTTKPNKISTVKINGIQYESMQSIVKNKQKILQDKASAYRHEKDKYDLQRIKAATT